MENFVLKAKSTMKRVAAISAGALMMGATVFGAAAAADYTLADYPMPFVTDGQWVGLIVVGADAASADVAGGIGVAATLAQVAAPGAAGGTTVTGGVTEDVLLYDELADYFGDTGVLDDTDLPSLMDTTIEVDDEDLDVHEEITLGAASPLIQISSYGDADYGADPVIEFAPSSVEYTYMFEEVPADWAVVDDDEPLEITFLGMDLDITAVDDDSVTAQIGTEYYMSVGDSVTVNGKTVELTDVGEEGSVVISVESTTQIVTGTKTINDIEIEVKDTFYTDSKEERAAVLVLGEDVSKEYTDGDEFIIPCATPMSEDCDEDNADWEWVIEMNNTATDELGVIFAGSWNEDDEPVLLEGETFYLPNNFAYITFDSLVVDDFAEYNIYFDEAYDLSDFYTDTEPVIVIEATGQDDEGLEINSVETDEVILYNNAGTIEAYYVDDDNDVQDSTKTDLNIDVTIEYGDTAMMLEVDGSDDITVDVEDDGNDDLVLNVSYAANHIEGFGTPEDAEATDAIFDGSNIGDSDTDVLFSYGVVMTVPEDGFEGDEVILMVPNDVQEATVIVGTQGTTVSSVGGGATTLGGVPVAKLDTEITDKTAYHMILVGGPAVNKLTAEAMGKTYPTYGEASGIPMNKGLLKLIDGAFAPGKVALVVAGWEAADTRAASDVLQDYQSYDLTGTAMEVTKTGGVISVGPVTVAPAE